MKDYYKILEVNENASKEVIEKTYKILIKKYHPDVHDGDKKDEMNMKIKELNEAYNVLSNDFLREQYDNEWNNERAEYFRNKYSSTTKLDNNSPKVENNEVRIKKEQTNSKKGDNINNIKNKSGTLSLMSDIFKKRSIKIDFKNITKTDMQAVGLTIIILIILGIILWFIPFTNGWMRQLIFENPLFSWIFR